MNRAKLALPGAGTTPTLLLVAEHRGISLLQSTCRAVTAASHLFLEADAEIHVLVAGRDAEPAAEAASHVAGVAKVLHLDVPPTAVKKPGAFAEQVSGWVQAVGYDCVMFTDTEFGQALASHVAADLDVAAVFDVARAGTVQLYADSSRRERRRVDVLTVRTLAFEPAAANGGCAPVVPLAALRAGAGGHARLACLAVG